MAKVGSPAPEAARIALVAVAAAAPFLPTLGPRPTVALHVAASLLVLALARRLGFGPLAATGAAILFGLHPVHVATLAGPGGIGVLSAAVLALAAAVAATFLPLGRVRWAAPAAALVVALAVALAAGWALGWSAGWPSPARGLWLLVFPRSLSAAAALADPARIAAEQALYLPSVVFCLAAIWAVKAAAEQVEPGGVRVGVGRLVPAVGVVLLVVLAARAAVYASEWDTAAADAVEREQPR